MSFHWIPEPPAPPPAKLIISPQNRVRYLKLKHPSSSVQGRDQRAQAESNFPVIKDAIANANATENPHSPYKVMEGGKSSLHLATLG